MDHKPKKNDMTAKLPILKSSKDYNKFQLCEFNRSVEKTKSLLVSMSKHGFIPAYPIHCVYDEDGNLRIKGGHHRFTVAQELGIPFYYVVSSDTAGIHELEKSTNRWSIADYLRSFVGAGIDAYITIDAYHKRTGIPLGMCVSMMAGECASSNNYADAFKAGSLNIRGEEHAEKVASLVEFCKTSGVKFASRAMVVVAMSRCSFTPEFDCETFKSRIRANPTELRPCRTLEDQMANFEFVYNLRARAETRLPLVFKANRAMGLRNANKAKRI